MVEANKKGFCLAALLFPRRQYCFMRSHSQYKLRALQKLEKLTGKKLPPETPLMTMIEEVAELTYRQVSNYRMVGIKQSVPQQGIGAVDESGAFELLFDLLALSVSAPQDAYRRRIV